MIGIRIFKIIVLSKIETNVANHFYHYLDNEKLFSIIAIGDIFQFA